VDLPGWRQQQVARHFPKRQLLHMQITTIGSDIAKSVFQVHGIDAAEKVVTRKQLRRNQVIGFFEMLSLCLIGMEACASAAHTWHVTDVWRCAPHVRHRGEKQT
jgi:hypothetical protein